MNRSVGRRLVSLRLLDSRPLAVRDDADELAQWDRLARRLHDAATFSAHSPMTTDLDHRHRKRPLRSSRDVGRRSASAPSRKSRIKTDLRRLKREFEAAVARGREACILAIAV